MEKTVTLHGRVSQEVTFSIWDIGGHKDSGSMLPLVCNDAAVILLVFDLTRHETLDSIREWHRKARGLNKCAMPLLVGAKYDLLFETSQVDHVHVEAMARKFAAAIEAPLIFCAPSIPINVTNIFKVELLAAATSSLLTPINLIMTPTLTLTLSLTLTLKPYPFPICNRITVLVLHALIQGRAPLHSCFVQLAWLCYHRSS